MESQIPQSSVEVKNVFKVVYLSSKRMCIGKSPYFGSFEMDILFADETKSSQ